jgi:hypothetical protein
MLRRAVGKRVASKEKKLQKELIIFSLREASITNLKMILGKIKQKQRVVFGLCVGVDLVHLLDEFLKVGPAFGDVIVPEMGIVYLNPFQNRHVCNIRLTGHHLY